MNFGVLGPLAVWRDGREVRLGGARQRGLLALLLVRANEVVSSAGVVDALWGERPPPSAEKAVKAVVWQLRKLLGTDVIETAPGGYVLRAARDAIDSQVFEVRLGRGRQLLSEGTADAASSVLAEALGLWRGPPYAEFGYQEFARNEIARLGELRLVAHELRLEADLALGRHGEIVAELQGLVVDHPLREQLRELLMLALYRAGRQADALAAYQQGRAVLVEELGLDPSASLKSLEQAILRHDPSLDPRAVVRNLRHGVDTDSRSQTRAPAALPVRKTVTIVVCSVEGKRRNGGRLDPESSRLLVERYFEAATAIVTRHGGTVETFIGDGVVGVFGVPVLHEDDAERAVRAAEELRSALGELNRASEHDFGAMVMPRLAITTGEVVIGTEAGLATEAVVAAAVRLQQAAGAGEVLLDPDTVELVREVVRAERLGGPGSDDEAAAGFRLLAVEPPRPRAARRLDVPMVARAHELAVLEDRFATATGRPSCVLVTVLGPAGVGKSRLAREFLTGLDADVLEGRCLSYGEGITYWPLIELMTALQGSHGELLADRPAAEAAIASLLGDSADPTTPDEIAWAVRKLLEALARERPLVVLLDDLHWAEPTLLDLVEDVAQLSQAVPILLLCLARPELLERRPGWGAGQTNATALRLEPLGPAETQELIGHLLRGGELAPELAARIEATAEGNPLFVEEMLAIVQESDADEVIVPPTIKALLAARIDQLNPTERQILGCGAIEGQLFHRSTVEALTAPPQPTEQQLAALVRKGFLRPDQPRQLPADEAYRFRHLLIRDAAYDALPKATRADLHERFAAWLDEHGGMLVERDELVGYHLQQADCYLGELGTPESETASLRERAAGFLAAAGRRATARGDYHAAVNLLERALALDVPDLRVRLQLQVELGLAFDQTGRHGEAEALLDTTVEVATEFGERGLAARALVHLSNRRMSQDPAVGAGEMIPVAKEAIRTFESLDDLLGLAEAERFLADALDRAGRSTESIAARERAIAHAQAAGATGIRRLIVSGLANQLSGGPTPAEEATGRLEELLESNRDDRVLAAVIRRQLACMLAMAGRFDEARAHLDTSAPVLDEANLTQESWGASRWQVSRALELMGETAAAEQDLIALYLYYRDTRGGRTSSVAINAAAHLANLCCDQGRWEEAADYLSYGEEVDRSPPPTGKIFAFMRLAARARLAAYAGRHAEATELGRTAPELARTMNNPDREARVWLALAEVQRRAGNQLEADDAVERALELYDRKGNITAAARVRADQPLPGSS
jgi:DNA-binding SARP family transcriptional activator